MRILILTSTFPASRRGGVMRPVAQVAERLAARGDEICVLTGEAGADAAGSDAAYPFTVRRELALVGSPGRGARRDERHRATVHNRFLTARTVSHWSPDAAVIFNLRRITLGPAQALEENTLPVLYTFDDEHLIDYLPGRFSLMPKRLTRFLLDRLFYRGDTVKSLELRHPCCSSEILKLRLLGSGAPVGHAPVIRPGVPSDRYRLKPDPGALQEPPAILCVGGRRPLAGAYTVLRSLPLLRRRGHRPRLTLVGSADEAYVNMLARMVEQRGLGGQVSFTGRISRGEFLDLYRTHDLFLFPSRRAEPSGLLHLEAMAFGLPVVSTLNGGQKEFLRQDENCACFTPGDPADLARSLARVLGDKALRARFVRAGRGLVETTHNLERYVADLCALLGRITEERAACA
jgi:glycosyltransferase involved in cell wall biosynthesis